jgi:cytoskeletal protein CcmA (bactofilin family)
MVKDVVLTGRFEGDLQTSGCLTVAPGGVMVGTVHAGGLVLKPGNLLEARVTVSVAPKPGSQGRTGGDGAILSGWKRGFQKLKELALGRA